jgi:1-acyl-sn-glycerol-3-phosphate acyltransferase
MPGDALQIEHVSSGATDVARPRKDPRFDVQAPERPVIWYALARRFAKTAAHLYSSVRVEGLDKVDGVAGSPALYCFSHQCWIDPMYVLAALPAKPRIYFFGPAQEDMRRGTRNRLMRGFGLVIPFAPGSRGLLAATQRAATLAGRSASIAIAGEGRIHCGESIVLPLKGGAAYIALRSGIPLVPVAINGTGWLGFRRRVRVRFGEPIQAVAGTPGRPRAAEVAGLTARAQEALDGLVRGFDDQPVPGLAGRWLTELFNDWPDGIRPSGGLRRAGPGDVAGK